MHISEESRLLIDNWDAYQDVLDADKKLRGEILKGLLSLENRMQACSLWDNAWHFAQSGTSQVYIWHNSWTEDGSPQVWVGLENVTAESIFGDNAPPQLYVWVMQKQSVLADRLREVFDEQGVDWPGGAARGKGCYVSTAAIPKCLPEDVDSFESVILEKAASFLIHYVGKQAVISETIRAQLEQDGA